VDHEGGREKIKKKVDARRCILVRGKKKEKKEKGRALRDFEMRERNCAEAVSAQQGEGRGKKMICQSSRWGEEKERPPLPFQL